MQVLFDNSTDTPIDEELIKRVIAETLHYENITDNAEISFSVVDNREIHEINKKHRNIDSATDVLSFPLIDFNIESLPSDGSVVYLGDIIISIERAYEQAEEYGHSIERELGFLTAHSMLHLLGYDHMAPDEEKIMLKKQEEILNNIGLKR